MGNDQPKKMAKATKGQIDIACLKAKIHLEMSRDRKHSEIIKGQKELVMKIKGKSRNKVEEILIAERVVNGLKYAQACNLLMSCAVSLRGHALFLADNQDKPDKIEPWLPFIYSLIYGADHLGLSSLNQFKAVLKALNDPQAVPKYTNPEIVQLLSASPTPEELNIYMVEFSERNGIPLGQINMIGHKFTTDFQAPPTEQEINMQKQLAEQMKKQFQNSWGNNQPNQQQHQQQQHQQGGFNGGFNGGQGGQGGFNGGQGGQGGFNGGFNGQGGFNGGFNAQGGQGFNGGFNEQPQNLNPYQKISEIKVGPDFHSVQTIKPEPKKQQPRDFSYQDIIGVPQNPNISPIYPSIDPSSFSMPSYKPPSQKQKNGVSNPFQRNSVVDVNSKGQPNNSPTISQILRDFK